MTGHWKIFRRLKVPRYIIVTETLCGDSYEWTTDEDGNEAIYTYDSEEAAEKELADDIAAINQDENQRIVYTGMNTLSKSTLVTKQRRARQCYLMKWKQRKTER